MYRNQHVITAMILHIFVIHFTLSEMTCQTDQFIRVFSTITNLIIVYI